MYERNTEKGS
ncbi:hypothetical protein ACMD2_22081, partial [Ananas comosus]